MPKQQTTPDRRALNEALSKAVTAAGLVPDPVEYLIKEGLLIEGPVETIHFPDIRRKSSER